VNTEDKSRKNHYGLEGRKRQIQSNVWDIGMCFDKREKGTWLFHICATPCKVPQFYLAGCCFPCCVAFYQRQLLLHDKMYEDYEFCQGKYGRFWCPSLAKKIPYCCLCVESFCCVGCAIGGNRVLMNERYMIADTISETIILLVAAILSFFGLFGGAAHVVPCVLLLSSLHPLLVKNAISWNIAFPILLHIYAKYSILSQFATSFLVGCSQLPLVTILVFRAEQERINITLVIV